MSLLLFSSHISGAFPHRERVPRKTKSPCCSHSKGEILPRYHLHSPVPHSPGLTGMLSRKRIRLHGSQPGTLTRANPSQPTCPQAFGAKLRDVFTCGSFARLSSAGCFLWGCPGCYLLSSKPFFIFLCLTAILAHLRGFVKPTLPNSGIRRKIS